MAVPKLDAVQEGRKQGVLHQSLAGVLLARRRARNHKSRVCRFKDARLLGKPSVNFDSSRTLEAAL